MSPSRRFLLVAILAAAGPVLLAAPAAPDPGRRRADYVLRPAPIQAEHPPHAPGQPDVAEVPQPLEPDASKIAKLKAKTQGQGLYYTAVRGTARCRVSTYDRWTAQKSEKRFRSA